jgi:hypothetical protein
MVERYSMLTDSLVKLRTELLLHSVSSSFIDAWIGGGNSSAVVIVDIGKVKMNRIQAVMILYFMNGFFMIFLSV